MADQRIMQDIAALVPRLRKFARVMCGNMADADDVVQATVEKAMRNIIQYQPGTRLDSWLFAIARNHWVDDRRMARNRMPHDDVDAVLDMAGDDGRGVTEGRDLQRRVRAAVDLLPAEQRELVGLVMIEGYGYREAADMLGIPIGTVMSRLSRAKAALAERLAEVGGLA